MDEEQFNNYKQLLEKVEITNRYTIRQTQILMNVMDIHSKAFANYKNKNAGKEIVLLAAGPTLKDFKPIENALYIGVNRTFKYDKVKLDYLFMEDYEAVKDYIEDAKDYNCEKFYGINNHQMCKIWNDGPIENWLIPESIAIRHGAKRFYSESPWLTSCIKPIVPFAYNLTSEPLYCYGSICFPAIQFALYTNPSKIYLVGCDCSQSGYFDDREQQSRLNIDYQVQHWKKVKEFTKDYYPETEIISVNPVGLKGIFKDLYQNERCE